MSYADTLTAAQRRRAKLMAIGSTCSGCISEVMLDSTAIVTLYILALGGSGAMTVMAAGLSGVASMFLYIPSASIVTRIGLKNAVKYACWTGMAGLLLMAVAPYFGALGKYAALLGCLIYCLQRPVYGASWYPLLDNFLRPGDRGSFFGMMRFTYMLLIGIPFFVIGLLMGKEASMILMQIIIAAAGVTLLGRWLFVEQFPLDPALQLEPPEIKKSLNISLHNGPLTGYAVYVCLFSLAYTPLYPLILAYLKEQVKLSAGNVQVISSVWICGQVIPFLLYGTMLRKSSLRVLELTVHFTVILVALALFVIPGNAPHFFWIAAALVMILSMAQSCFMCNNSGEILALARPGNKSMAGAFVQTYQGFGSAVGRNLSSAVLAMGILSDKWNWGGLGFNRYQTLFLGCAVVAVVILILLPIMPSVISKHDDYYEP